MLVAGAFSTTGASHIILRLGGLSIIQCIAPLQVREEAERNLRYKMPEALPVFRTLTEHALTIVPDPAKEEAARFLTQAHPEDASILAAAMMNECQYLLTFNTRHYRPAASTSLSVLTPGKFLQQFRRAVSRLAEPERL